MSEQLEIGKPAKRVKKAERPLSEAELMVLLRERYAAPEYAFMPHVRNGTGYTRRTVRTADALAMSLWPSRGLDLIGFEIKSDRRDWLNEKANPEKAEEIARFCDRWVLVVGAEDIVHAGELPQAWGLLVASGGKLIQRVEPQKLEAKPLDRAQLAAILRRAAECVIPKDEIDAALEAEQERAAARLEQRVEMETRTLRDRLAEERRIVAEFEAASGVHLNRWDAGRIGDAVRFVLSGGVEQRERQLRDLLETARGIATDVEARLAALPRTGTEG